jgi:hypothetical protein
MQMRYYYRYHMCEINHFKAFVLYSCDIAADVDHLHVKIIYLEFLMGHLYIVREDYRFLLLF